MADGTLVACTKAPNGFDDFSGLETLSRSDERAFRTWCIPGLHRRGKLADRRALRCRRVGDCLAFEFTAVEWGTLESIQREKHRP